LEYKQILQIDFAIIYNSGMPHVSKHRVKKNIFKKIQLSLIDVFMVAGSKYDTARLIGDLLTPTEKIMLAKRIAIILMLNEGYSFKAIERTLKITPATVLRFWKMKKKGKFNYLTEKKIKESDFWKDLEKFLEAGLPPRGKGRWKHVFDAMDRAEERSERIYGKYRL
jgi:uncharacterized protein YerC